MKIHELFIVKKGLTDTSVNLKDEIVSLLRNDRGDNVNCDNLIPGDILYLNTDLIDKRHIPSRTYINKVKNPKKDIIDVLVIFQQGDKITKPVRYKQPDPDVKSNNENSKDLRIKFTIPNIDWEYSYKTNEQITSWYKNTVKEGLSGFKDEEEFLLWYKENVQDKKCKYCGLSERESQEVVHRGILTSLRFPIYNNTSRGVNRGYWLEIDRKNPTGLYSIDNCNPSCYFCNNDKSDVFSDLQYVEFTKDRLHFLKKLLNATQS